MEKGQISVQTENILPIIKKFLYSDHEIFLRELVSNAVDASQKLKILASKGEVKDEIKDLTIEIKVDEKNKTITISDKGIGMTEQEVKKYINQIAFSSAEEFLKKHKDKTAEHAVIGNFGLGFYSSYMVADKVEIYSKSYKRSAAVKWSCDGSTEFVIEKTDKKDRGTDIVLHISDDSKEYLEKMRIQGLLEKYSKFLPIEIKFDDKVINNTAPAWKKKPAKLTEKNYLAFYKELYPYSEPPLFWIHLNVDYPFNLTGILYFPKLKNTFEVQKDKIQLYCNQVFVTDSVEEIVPEFLMLLHGVIDSPDIPLNVSRSFLQSDPNVKKINNYIAKKVAEKLDQLFKKDRKSFEEKWEHINVFVKYGIISDEKFFEKAQKFSLFQDVDDKFHTIDEYKEAVKANQTDKDDNIVALYTNNVVEQDSYIQAAKARSYNVLKLDTIIDNHYINRLEQKLEKFSFKRVDADTIDKLIEKDTKKESLLTKNEEKKVKTLFEKLIDDKLITVDLEGLSKDDQPIIITKPELTRRMKDMAAVGGMDYMKDMPEQYQVVINTNHPVISNLAAEKSPAKNKKAAKHLYDIALLSQNMLKGNNFTEFLQRSVEMMAGNKK